MKKKGFVIFLTRNLNPQSENENGMNQFETEDERKIVSDIEPSAERPTFVPSRGSRVGGQHKDKKQRITEALSDLQLVFAGMAMMNGGIGEQNIPILTQTTGSLARACSIFLRKVLLGDGGNREARLLDDSVLESLEMHLQPLRKIPTKERRSIETGFRMEGAFMSATKLDEVTKEPKERYIATAREQGLSIVVEWPLLGMADLVEGPAGKLLWEVNPDQLFETTSERAMGCNEWLGQQAVLFDGLGITLEKLIRTLVNLEGAHSINVGRLFVVEGETPSSASKEPHVHILKIITLCGIGYAELVIIETAMYLCERLLEEPSIEKPIGEFNIAYPVFELPREQVMSTRPSWLGFRGDTIISFAPTPGIVTHTIRSPG